ncbi:MAG: amidase domain-containing protein [Bifidobacteriaceae bacterium]|jgi:hypothetical protein|nr:amidase domain-containing protein [Bifidobacteriaceae bacterium]
MMISALALGAVAFSGGALSPRAETAEATPGPRFVAVPLSAAQADDFGEEVAAVVEDLYSYAYLGDTASTDSDVAIDADSATAADLAAEIGGEVGATDAGVEALTDYGEALSGAADRLAQAPTDLEVTAVTVETRSVEATRDAANGELLLEASVLVTTEYNDGGPPCEEVIDHLITLDGATGEIADVIALDLDMLTEAPDQSLGVAAVEPASARVSSASFAGSVEGGVADAALAGLSAANKRKIADYAYKYAVDRNTSHRDFTSSGGDCTNFVSQALKAGGWKHLERVIPIYTSDDEWWYWSWPKLQTYSWTSAQHFANHAARSGRTTGIYYVKDMVKGDLLQYRLKSYSTMAWTTHRT